MLRNSKDVQRKKIAENAQHMSANNAISFMQYKKMCEWNCFSFQKRLKSL